MHAPRFEFVVIHAISIPCIDVTLDRETNTEREL
jgi:hypothetical protein